jgi:hypothetical protein
MTAQIETIFTSSIYHNNLNFNLKKFCLDIQKIKNQNTRSGVNSWQSENIINDLPKDFLNCLNDEVNNYKNFLNVKKKVTVEYVWLNVNKKGSYNLEHDHPNCFISGVYYINLSAYIYGSGSADVNVFIYVNGSTTIRGFSYNPGNQSDANPGGAQLNATYYLNAGDYVEPYYSGGSTSLTIWNGGPYSTHLCVYLLG